MKRKILLFTMLSLSELALLHAQVGINTNYPRGVFHIDGAGDNPKNLTTPLSASQVANDIYIEQTTGNVGIGTVLPQTKLHIVTAGTSSSPISGFTLQDGSQSSGYILTSMDNLGTASWSSAGFSEFTQVDYHSKVLNLNIGPNFIDTGISIDFKKYGTYLLILGVRTVFTMTGVSMNVLQFRTQTAPDPKTVWESPSIGRIAGSYEMYGTSFHNDQDKRFYFTQTMTLDAATGTKVHLLMFADCPTAGSVTLSLGGTNHIETGGSYIRIN